MFTGISVGQKGEGVASTVVIAYYEGKEGTAEFSPSFGESTVKATLEREDATGENGNLVEASVGSRRVFLLGLGKKEKVNAESLRTAFARLGRKLSSTKATEVELDFSGTLKSAGVDLYLAGRCLGESLGLLSWNYTELRGTATKKKEYRALQLVTEDKTLEGGITFGLSLSKSVNLARDLSQTPPNIANPLYMAERARKLAAETGLSCRVITGDELALEKMEGLINTGKGSVNPPCLIRLEYRPEGGAEGVAPVVLLGKTITFDTGGYSLKISNGMVGMKRDKDGGCAILGAMHAIATLIKPKFPVVGLLVSAENSISSDAMRPDDVLTYRNGVTVEVTNTDAEGRLVLADGLVWACEVEKATCIVDLATLTGGVVTALGSTFAGLFCEDDALRGKLDTASTRSGERVWRLPMHTEYREMMKSPIADILNSNPNRKAHPIQGAAFLSYFVTEETPWAHLDIAGVHATDSDAGAFIKGPTGFGVRLLADFIAGM